jgi:hypothetical protein
MYVLPPTIHLLSCVLMHFASQEQHLSLFFSFRSVKFEWSGLDGMRSVRRRYNVRQRLWHAYAALPFAPHFVSSTRADARLPPQSSCPASRTQHSSTPARGTQSACPRSRSRHIPMCTTPTPTPRPRRWRQSIRGPH